MDNNQQPQQPTPPQENKPEEEQPQDPSLLDKVKKVVDKLPSISFQHDCLGQDEGQSESQKTKMRGIWLTFRF